MILTIISEASIVAICLSALWLLINYKEASKHLP